MKGLKGGDNMSDHEDPEEIGWAGKAVSENQFEGFEQSSHDEETSTEPEIQEPPAHFQPGNYGGGY